MTDQKHTPGPWHFELEPPDSKYGVVIIGDHGIVTHAADARLIAAAPMLLEACEELADSTPLTNLRGPYEWNRAVAKLNAAIKAAKGE